MAIFDTSVPQANLGGLTRLVAQASQSPLSSLGKTMSELDAIVTNRAKEKYTSGISQQLAQAQGQQGFADVMKTIDPTMLTKEGADQFKTLGTQLYNLENLGLQQQQEARLAEEQALKYGTPQQRLEATTTLGSALALAPDQYDEPKELEALRAANADNPVMVAEIDKLLEAKVGKAGTMNSYEQKLAAARAYRMAQDAYAGNPSEENRKALSDARDIYTTMASGGPEAVRRIQEGAIVRQASTMGTKLLKGDEDVDYTSRLTLEDNFKNTESYKALQKDEQKFKDSDRSIKALSRLHSTLDSAIQAGNFDTGPLANLQQTLGELTPEGWSALSGKTTQEIMIQAGLEGQIGSEVAEILREMSGLAATDGEFRRTLINTIGGTFAQEGVKLERLRSFINTRNKRAIDIGEELVKSGLVGRTYDMLNDLKAIDVPAPQSTQTTTPQVTQKSVVPNVGAVMGGYRFKGGNPNDQNNWEKL